MEYEEERRELLYASLAETFSSELIFFYRRIRGVSAFKSPFALGTTEANNSVIKSVGLIPWHLLAEFYPKHKCLFSRDVDEETLPQPHA